jgi:hypothetical protein
VFEGVNTLPRGQSSPLGSNFTPEGKHILLKTGKTEKTEPNFFCAFSTNSLINGTNVFSADKAGKRPNRTCSPGWPDALVKKVAQNVAQPIFLGQNQCKTLTVEKSYPRNCDTSEIPIKQLKVNKLPMGENSPNLVTLLFPSTLMILKESTMYVDIGDNEEL